MKNKKWFIYFVFLLIVLIIFVYTEFSSKYVKKGTGKVFLYGNTDNFVLTIKNSLPITDQVGKTFPWDSTKKDVLGYMEFYVQADTLPYQHEYELYLTDVSSTFSIDPDYIKIYLTDDNDVPINLINSNLVTSYSQLKVAKSDLAGKRLYAGFLGKGEIQKFKLRIWLADTYALIKDDREFSIKINLNTLF